jgi:putative ABC transport system permease protein
MNVLMNRMVAQQRSIVGVLKAQGVSTAAIARHYLAAGAFIGAIGGLGGIALTLSIQGPYTSLYAQFYKIEFLRARFYPDLHLLGVGISALFASAGALKAALRAARLQPALAMRPPEPERGGRIFIERAAFVWNRLSFSWRLVLRAVFRNPFRSGVSLIAVLLSTSLIVTAFNMVDSLDYLMEYQFKVLQREDVTVTLRDPRGVGGPHELAGAAGMALVEPQLNVICDLVNGARSKRLSVSGLPRDHTLFNPMDEKGRPISIPAEGLVLGKKTAEVLGVEVGDTVSLRPLIGERKTVEAPVVGIAEVFFGLAAYADIAYLSRLLGEEWAANSLLADRFGEGDWEATYAELKERPTVVAVTRRERAFEQMESTFGETQGMMIGIMVLFAGLIAFGSVLNTALVSLSEREREVGTFRVLGFTPGEVAAILRGEQAFLSVFGIALGLWGGVLLSHLISAAYNTELYRFPVVIRGWRLVQASLLMAGFIAAAQLLIRRFIGRIDWLDAIKINE